MMVLPGWINKLRKGLNAGLINLTVLLVSFIFADILFDQIAKALSLNPESWIKYSISLSISIVFSSISYLYQRQSRYIRESREEIKSLSSDVRADIQAALDIDKLSNNYRKISIEESSPEIHRFINRLNKEDNEDHRISSMAFEFSKLYLDRISTNDLWYIILQRYIDVELRSTNSCRFNLALETYLNIYLEIIEYYLSRCERDNKHLHIYSFTNASPKDWFEKSQTTGGNVVEFGFEKSKSIKKLRRKNHTMRMYVMASDNEKLNEMGIKGSTEIKHEWLERTPLQRGRYINELHSHPDDAVLMEFLIDNLSFDSNLTEFIYFGTSEQDSSLVKWEWCLAGGYSPYNDNILAMINNLTQNGDEFIINVENAQEINYNNALKAPERIQITYSEFPSSIASPRLSNSTKFSTLVPLQERWSKAAEIWHNTIEEEILSSFFEEYLSKNSKILDCAAGTGFHIKILNKCGFTNVLGSELSEDEVNLLNKSIADIQPTIQTFSANWNTFKVDLKNETFDAILCIGSSIPYYSSWEELANTKVRFKMDSLKKVVKNFEKVLNPGGTLIIGLARHNVEWEPGYVKKYQKVIDEVDFKMKWEFDFDWKNQTRLWNCEIISSNHEDYSFKAVGHLFTIQDLQNICDQVFGNSSTIIDYHIRLYDKFLIVKKT